MTQKILFFMSCFHFVWIDSGITDKCVFHGSYSYYDRIYSCSTSVLHFGRLRTLPFHMNTTCFNYN